MPDGIGVVESGNDQPAHRVDRPGIGDSAGRGDGGNAVVFQHEPRREQLRTRRVDRCLGADHFMHRQIVDDDAIAAVEWGNKALTYKSKKHRPVHRAIEHERCRHPTQAQTRHERDRLPMALWGVANQTLFPQATASQSHQRAAGTGFVYEYQSTRTAHRLLSDPTSTLRQPCILLPLDEATVLAAQAAVFGLAPRCDAADIDTHPELSKIAAPIWRRSFLHSSTDLANRVGGA